ncbi:hypothetical protein Poli38472_009056 [Pythium oligandrum]|uniref:Uncharacterized protein n=1 Tax=Pythium oligandrum TaxID=41045 RepID=A0A8K1FL51_PYTOL|nr:hypothetical protein Poli38472_009056 [Pythium oligandrum]|eukprot:TMW64889.1 hypothetical protein Poli38472_009056 [Pythium oligandrum]
MTHGKRSEATPLLAETAEVGANSKKHATFSRWRKDMDSEFTDATASGGKPRRGRELLCLQFSLILLVVVDLVSLLVITVVSLGAKEFASYNWLVDADSIQWRYWGLPVVATVLKITCFALATTRPHLKVFSYLSHGLCAGFVYLLAVDSFRLDSFTQLEEESYRLVDANIANSIPLIFTVLEVVNLDYLMDSLAPPAEHHDLNVPAPPPKPQGISFVKLMYILKPYFWPHGFGNKVRASSTYVLLGISKVANLAAPLFMARATNALFASNSSDALVNVALFCGLSLVSKIFKELQSLIYLKVKQTAYIELATLTYEHVHSLSYDWHVQKKLGDVLRSMDRGVESANSVVSYVFLSLFPTLAESVVVVVIFAAHFQLASLSFVAFSSLVVYAVLTIKITLWRKKFREASTKHDNEYHDKATDALINYETVKYFSNEKYEVDTYTKVVEKYQSYSISVQASLSLLNGAQAAIIQLTTLAVLGLAVPHIVRNDTGRQIDIGDFVAISVYLVNLFQPLFWLGSIYNMVINSVVDMRKLSELLSVEPDIVDLPDAQELTVCEHAHKTGIEVRFVNVNFHYPSQAETTGIKDMSFTIRAGTTAALVGETGAGKTTISRLLFRFYECNTGKILVNHQDIRHVTQRSLRNAIGIVPQDTVLFNDTILNNIKYGDLTASFDQVVTAAKNARVYDFIMSLPEQWNTKVGERGLKLSGGEKQRVAIARTLLKDPPFVILDEATSALDTVTEREIQSALNRLQKNRTMLVIAHRLSTVRNADQILVLRDGTLAESGNHDELLATQGIYHRLWTTQQKSNAELAGTEEE